MFSQVMKNSAWCAKVHAMAGKALDDKDYEAIMNMKSVPAVATYLVENTDYKNVLQGVRLSDIHRGRLEQILREHLRAEVERILPFVRGNSKKFMKLMELEEGITKVKVCLRILHMGHFEQVYEYIRLIPEFEAKQIPEINSVDDFIEFLRGTLYFNALSIFLGKGDRQTEFRMEMELDTYWANLVYKYAKKYLAPDEAKAAYKVYGTEIDIDNLSFLLRCKRTFDMTDDEIYASIVPRHYRLKQSTIAEIVKSSSYEDALSIINEQTPYGEAFSKTDRFIEKRQTEYLLKRIEHVYKTNRYSIQSLICYFHLQKIEIDNIVSIIEGIRYGLEPEKIAGYLTGYGKGEKLL